MKLNDEIRTDMKNSVLCWLATVDPSGIPNATPKEIFTSHRDDRIVIADIASSLSKLSGFPGYGLPATGFFLTAQKRNTWKLLIELTEYSQPKSKSSTGYFAGS